MHKVKVARYRVLEILRVTVCVFSDDGVLNLATKSRCAWYVTRRTAFCVSCARAKENITIEMTHKNLLCLIAC
jgi:hypothetical protein